MTRKVRHAIIGPAGKNKRLLFVSRMEGAFALKGKEDEPMNLKKR